MSAVHLVPVEAGADFPYDAAKTAILAMPDMQQGDVDFNALINTAIENQWPKEIITNYENQRASGLCFEFKQSSEPFLQGTMYPDNIRFAFKDATHQEFCDEAINDFAAAHGLKRTVV